MFTLPTVQSPVTLLENALIAIPRIAKTRSLQHSEFMLLNASHNFIDVVPPNAFVRAWLAPVFVFRAAHDLSNKQTSWF